MNLNIDYVKEFYEVANLEMSKVKKMLDIVKSGVEADKSGFEGWKKGLKKIFDTLGFEIVVIQDYRIIGHYSIDGYVVYMDFLRTGGNFSMRNFQNISSSFFLQKEEDGYSLFESVQIHKYGHSATFIITDNGLASVEAS